MSDAKKQPPVTLNETLISSLAQTDALAKLLIERDVFTQHEFLEKIAEERATSAHVKSNAA